MNNVRYKRKELGITQKGMARNVGISVSMLQQIEQGTRNPSLKNMKKIATYLNESLDALFFAPIEHSK